MVDPLLANFVVIECPSCVSLTWQSPVRPSVFRPQYLPPKPLGRISQFFTGLIGPLSDLFKCLPYKEIWLPWQPKGNIL